MNGFRCKLHPLKNHRVVLRVLDPFTRQIMEDGLHCGHVDEIERCPVFENVVPRMEALKPLNPKHDPPLCYHRWKTTLLGGGQTNTLSILPLSRPCAEWRRGTVSGSNIDYLPFYNAVDLEGKLEEFTNFYTLLRLHSSLDESTSARIDKGSTLDRAKIDNPLGIGTAMNYFKPR